MDIFYLEEGKIKKAAVKQLSSLKNKFLWIDVTDITKKEEMLLQKEFDLHPVTAEDLFKQEVRIKLETFPNYLFCVFYGVKEKKNIELIELDFVLGKNFLITNHKNDIDSCSELKKDKEKLKAVLLKGSDFVFHKILDMETDNYFPVLGKIDEELETVEEEISWASKPEQLRKILALKTEISTIKKHVLPQREKISYLAKEGHRYISQEAMPYFRDIYDHSIRVSDAIEHYKEMITAAFDLHMLGVTNSTNEVMKVLSIIATIALPLTVISSIYGTNFAYLPGAGRTYGFWIMLLMMLMLISSMIFFFKKRGWF